MPEYDFSTINDKDLEELTRELLNLELELNLQTFKSGKDGGIDLRYSGLAYNTEIIVQVKHYIRSPYSVFRRKLIKEELPKIKELKPERYIVVTSLELSPQEKDEIKEELSPYIKTADDVYGRQDLNYLLAKHPKVEQNWYKLWLSSTTALKTIFHNKILGRSNYLTERIRSRLKYYVESKNLKRALNILDDKSVLVITGGPGVGKSTLAEIIIYRYLKEGFSVINVVKIDEAEDLFSSNPDEKQLFYFDDFLGATSYDPSNSNYNESQTAQFIDRIRNAKNKYFLLTSRSVILNYANRFSDQIKNTYLDTNEYELKVRDYGDMAKAKILYNHIFFSNVSEELASVIFQDRFYMDVIKHNNYIPRTIEHITRRERVGDIDKAQYKELIIESLNNPESIWKNSFEVQIANDERAFLWCIFSLKNTERNLVVNTFQKRLQFEKDRNGLTISNSTESKVVSNLQNGFIYREISRYVSEESIHYNFINPSLEDYLRFRLKNNETERWALLNSIVYIEQLERLSPKFIERSFSKKELSFIYNLLIHSQIISVNILSVKSLERLKLKRIKLLTEYCRDFTIEEHCVSIYKSINKSERIAEASMLYEIVFATLEMEVLYDHFHQNFEELVVWFIEMIDNIEEFELLESTLSIFGKSNRDIFKKDSYAKEILIDILDDFAKHKRDDIIKDLKDDLFKKEDLGKINDEIILTIYPIYDSFDLIIHSDNDMLVEYNTVWEEIIDNNLDIQEQHEADSDDLFYDFPDNDLDIDNLFG